MKKIVATLIAWGPAGLLVLAAADSAGIPIPGGVDALLIYLASRDPSRLWLLAAIATLGSLAGSYILYAIAKRGGEAYLHRHTLSSRGMRFRTWFQHYGLVTVFIPALLPIPLPMKVFVICAGALGVRLAPFLVVVLGARIPRYLALAYLGASLGNNATAYLRSHVWHLLGFAAGLFLLLYVLIRYADARRASRTR